MQTSEHSQATVANPPRVAFIPTASDRAPQDERRTAMAARLRQLLLQHRLTFTLTAFVVAVLLAGAHPAQAQTALQRNTATAQLHIQVYLVHPVLSQAPMSVAPAAVGGVTYNIAPAVPQLPLERNTAVTPLPPPPAAGRSTTPAVLETTSIVPR